MTDRVNQIHRLQDGRQLGYAEYGDRHGKPVFFFHGWPGSRLVAKLFDELAVERGARIIAPDRPGFGLSDFKPGRRIVDWPDDVLELAAALGIERFAVAGASGGGPYAAVCGVRVPERLESLVIINGVAPFDAPAVNRILSRRSRRYLPLARHAPWLLQVPLALRAREARRDPEGFLDRWAAPMPEPDKRVLLGERHIGQLLIQDFLEAFRQGARGVAWEARLYTWPWGFRLHDIPVPVHLWQGERDAHIPVAMGRYQAATIPHCTAHFHPGEGHFSLIFNHAEEIVSALVSPAEADEQ